MEKFLSDYRDKTKLFFGDTDSFSIIDNKLTAKEISKNLLLSALLYDVVLFPAAYSWQSEIMSEVLHRNQALVLCERAIPVIRNFSVTRDVKDYYDKREEETAKHKHLEVYKDPSLNSELVKRENRKDMEFAYSLNTYMHLEDISVKEAFIEIYKKDINDKFDDKSIYNIFQRMNYSEEQRAVYRRILKDNVDYDKFSRSTVIGFINKMGFNKGIENRLRRRVSNLYLLANAIAADAGFYISIDNNAEVVNYSNLDMHKRILESFGITDQVLDEMTATDVLRIVFSDEYKIFISFYKDLIFEIQNTNSTKRMNVEMIKKSIDEKIDSQNAKESVYKTAGAVGKLSASVLGGLIVNYISGSTGKPLFYGIGMAGGFTTTNLVLDWIKRMNFYISRVGYSEFKQYIINEVYKKEKHITINGVIL